MTNKVLDALKQIFQSFKFYFILILLLLAALSCFLIFNNKKAYELISLLQKRLESREKEIEALRSIELERQQKQKEIDDRYQVIIQELKENHRIEIQQISKDKEIELKRLIQEYENNPEGLSSRLESLFGADSASESKTSLGK